MDLDAATAFANNRWWPDTVTINGVEVKCCVDYTPQSETAQQAEVTVLATAVPSPAPHDLIVIDGEEWRAVEGDSVHGIRRGDGGVWIIPITRDLRPTFRR